MRWVFLALLVVPLIEVAVIVAVGRTIGGWPTFLLLLLESLLGAWIVRREGGRAWAALRDALRTGRMPSRELADAALVLVGGTLLLTPGFVTDVAGFLVVLPLTRPVTRRWLEAAVARRLLGPFGSWPGGPAGGGAGGEGPPDVIQGEVVD
ncbi:FxsA family protein [Phycicoccus endophyticus]|uniref:FxsA family protein n=1 Tax=Phycicoccus endophyticus TaxID=1690220 RepID=A0A7G9R5R8_9MICO|nr:FxsA family protein [Phycicoccus endophyticus]QNN50943.1 FxsA family protein [Phycicoccus endophyticus]